MPQPQLEQEHLHPILHHPQGVETPFFVMFQNLNKKIRNAAGDLIIHKNQLIYFNIFFLPVSFLSVNFPSSSHNFKKIQPN
jgi:hypothetical protein